MSSSGVAYQSGRPKIPLYNDYSDVRAVCWEDEPCDNITHLIVIALFILNNDFGSTLEEIQAFIYEMCPDISLDDIEATLNVDIRRGVFRSLRPPVIDYTKPLPPVRYSYSEQMDTSYRNASAVRLLIGLCGGLWQYGVQGLFTKYFIPYTNPKNWSFELDSRVYD